MPLDSYELDRLADEQYLQRRITSSTYCGECGYNLRTLPYVYTCPECGNQYNARPLHRKGIFDPYALEFPLGDVAATLLSALCSIGIFIRGFRSSSAGTLLIGVMFLVLTILLGVKAYGRLARYLKAKAIARLIAAEEEEI